MNVKEMQTFYEILEKKYRQGFIHGQESMDETFNQQQSKIEELENQVVQLTKNKDIEDMARMQDMAFHKHLKDTNPIMVSPDLDRLDRGTLQHLPSWMNPEDGKKYTNNAYWCPEHNCMVYLNDNNTYEKIKTSNGE